jgi:acetyl-CoA synthetase (ADP-forming)
MRTGAAMKVVSAVIPHKTESGGVVLGIESPDEAAEAFHRIEECAAGHLESNGLPEGIEGVMVSPMMATPLAELLLGARRDPDLGPVLTIGAGGIWVEVLKDVSHRMLPVGDEQILDMLAELRIFGLLSGARGRESADIDAVVAAAQAVSRCILEHREVCEAEVNPLFLYAQGAEAVDARIFLGDLVNAHSR